MTTPPTAPTVEDLAGAEAVLGVAYTPAERAMIAETIAGQIVLAARRRAFAMPRELAPATIFDPRLPGWQAPKPTAFRPHVESPAPLPSTDEAIAFAPVVRLANWIRSGAITSVRLTEIYLERIARLGPRLECIALPTPDIARAQAARADAMLAAGKHLGPLHGIPWGCKDLFDTAGIATAWGAEPFRGRIPDRNSTVVQRLEDAGAVMVAKTAVGALAYGDIWYGGVSRNPWNLAEGSSGSSAGSAAGVAAGLFAFALGTETLGSIVMPSARCGAAGLRPTFGRVARTGAMPLCWTLDKVGALARTVEDTGVVLAAINGADPGDPGSIAMPLSYDADRPVSGLRVGYFPDDFALSDAPELDNTVLDAARRLGMQMVPLKHGGAPYEALMNVIFAEAAASFEELTLHDIDDQLRWQDPGAWPNSFRRARFLSAIDHIQLDRLRRHVMQEMDDTFHKVDAIVGPVAHGPMLIITNFTGHPCLTLRSGFLQSRTRGSLSLAQSRIHEGTPGTADARFVPHGICIWGKLFDEGTVLNIGRALECELNVWDRRPPLA